jgi:hypothetical protein
MDHLSTQKSRKISVITGLRPGSVASSRLLLMLLSSLAILLAYCTPPGTHKQAMVANRPQTKVFKTKPDILREAVERALKKKKYSLNAERTDQLHLETEWLEQSGYKTFITAEIKPISRNRTELTLHQLIEKKKLFKEEWEPLDVVGEDTYKIWMGDIEMETYRVLYERI